MYHISFLTTYLTLNSSIERRYIFIVENVLNKTNISKIQTGMMGLKSQNLNTNNTN